MGKKTRKKKHILSFKEQSLNEEYALIGIKTNLSSHRLVYELNRIFDCKFKLSEKPHQEKRNNMLLNFPIFQTPRDNENNRLRLLHNETLVELETSTTFFSTKEAFFLFPEIKAINYLLFVPRHNKYTCNFLKENYKSPHPVKWIDIDLNQIKSPFPIFVL